MEVLKKNKEIIKVLFALNVLAFIVSLFYFNKTILIITLGCNIFFLGVNLIIQKYAIMFEGVAKINSFANKMNERLKNV